MRCEQVGRARDGKGWEGHSGLRIGMQCEVMGWACAVKRSKGGAICVGVKPDSTRPVRGCWLLRLFIAFAATLALGLANTIINRGMSSCQQTGKRSLRKVLQQDIAMPDLLSDFGTTKIPTACPAK